MTVSVAMYEKSREHIGARLEALGLDIKLHTFGKDGQFRIDGATLPPQDVQVDYMWLSNHINEGGFREAAFNTVLACKSIGVLQTFNAGLDDPVYKQVSDRGTRIVNSSAQGVAIAEYVMAQALSVIHPIELQRKQQAEKKWAITPFRELSQMSWLIIGYGPIGQELSKRVKAFEAHVAVVRRSPQAPEWIDEVGTMADLKRLLPKADVVVLACSLTETTRGFADRQFFAALKPDALLINIARGALIDDAALLAALDGGGLAHAVLDVFHAEPLPPDNPLWTHPKVRLTPHTSFAGNGARGRWDQLFLDNLTRFVDGEALHGEVNPADIS